MAMSGYQMSSELCWVGMDSSEVKQEKLLDSWRATSRLLMVLLPT